MSQSEGPLVLVERLKQAPRIRLSLRPSGTLDVLNFLELDFVISERAQIHRRHTFRALSFAINAPSAARFCSLRQAL
jgi:hypothetical protein